VNESSYLQSIAGDVDTIQTTVVVLSVFVGALMLALTFGAIKIASALRSLQPDDLLDGMEAEKLQMHAEEALAKNREEEALELSENMLASRPSHVQANWYAGVALYRLGRIHEATRRFEKLVEIAPEWEPTVEAYLERLRMQANESKPSLVKPGEPLE
jgi:tetratricopeptide (TPR) repeat protein